MNTIISNPRAHRAAWVLAHPRALLENGGLLSREDLERWACDVCMAPLDPAKPIKALDDMSLCPACLAKTAPEGTDFSPCQCAGCSPKPPDNSRCPGREKHDNLHLWNPTPSLGPHYYCCGTCQAIGVLDVAAKQIVPHPLP